MDATTAWIIELQTLSEPPLPPTFDISRWSDDGGAAEEPDEADALPLPETPSGQLTFIKRRGRYRLQRRPKIRNDLLAAVGFLEVANASDFAANVWNTSPIPIYALVLMGMGGVLALGMIYFVVKDALLSLQNLRHLRDERRYLRAQRSIYRNDAPMRRTIDAFLDLNFRESGTELIDRVGMDALMGFGAFIVGIGTFVAMRGGTDHDVSYRASNLLTGYIGNTPCAIYGAFNLVWSAWVWRRAQRQRAAAIKTVRGTRLEQMLKMRTSSVQLHAALNGISGVVAGAASLATATLWWGYVVLAPCLVTTGLVNMFWRQRLGYDRPLVQQVGLIDEQGLITALRYTDSSHQRVRSSKSDPFSTLVSDTSSMACVLDAITSYQLFEEFCALILRDAALSAALFGVANEKVTVDVRDLTPVDNPTLVSRLLIMAKALMNEKASKSLSYQERYLLEILGSFMCCQGPEEASGDGPGSADPKRPMPQPHNVYTECGRHGNQWLFGGFSVTGSLAWILQKLAFWR